MTTRCKPCLHGQQLLLMVAALSAGVAIAATCNSVTSGDWDQKGTWSCNLVPDANDDVIITNGTTVNLKGDRNALNFTIQAGGTLTDAGKKLTTNGTAVVINGTWSGAGNGNLDLKPIGSVLSGTGTVTGSTMFTFKEVGSIAAGSNLTFTDAANSQVVIDKGDAVTNNGTLTVARVIGKDAKSVWTNAANSTLNVLADLMTTGILDASACGAAAASRNTVNYSGTVAQAIKLPSGGNYCNLSLTGSNTKTPAAGTYNILGDFLLDTGVTYGGSTNNPVVNLARNMTDNGTFTVGSGMFTFNGTSAQQLTGSTATTVFRQVTLNNSTGLSLVGTHNMQVNTALTLTSGRLTTNSNVLYIATGGLIGNAGASTFVVGNLKKRFATGANVSRVFEVGTEAGGVRYAPVTVNFGNVTTAGDLTITGTAGDHPSIGTSTLDAGKSVNRYWTLANSGIAFDANAANQVIFTFVAADVDGGANTANVLASRFSPALPGAGSWTEITPSARTATTTTLSGTGITTANVNGDYQIAEKSTVVAPGSFDAFETSTTPNPGAITGRIYTKLAGTAFSLDVVAITAGAQQMTFTTTASTKKVLVDLVTGSTGGANCPGSPVSVVGTSRTMDLVSGRSTTASFTVASALRDVRVRIRYPDDVPTVTACSTDNFTIRPTGFTSVTSNMTNSGSSGTPVAKAGASFSITAVTNSGYDGTPKIDAAPNTLILPHTGAVQAGSVVGTFPAATAGSTTGTFTYSEVGNFKIDVNGVYDDSYFATTTSDKAAGDCVVGSFSSSVDGTGRYGCNFGNTAQTATIGRFQPDHFDVDLTTTPPVFAAGCVAGGFTYVGQLFNYATQPVIYVTAKNVANAVTKNYTGASWFKITGGSSGSLTGKTYTALSGSSPLLDTTSATASDPAVTDTGNGTGAITFSSSSVSGTGFFFTRGTAIAPFNAEISLSINVIDSDGVIYTGNPARFGQATAGNGISFTGGKAVRFGRLAIGNRSGSQLLPLPVPIEAQYFDGKSFVTNTLDNCTAVAPANVAMGSYTGTIDPGAGACKTAISGGGPLAAGRGTVTLSAPTGAASGSVTLTPNLGATASGNVCTAAGAPPGGATAGNRQYLQGNWTSSSFDQNPNGRATFGVYTGAEEVIYTRENF